MAAVPGLRLASTSVRHTLSGPTMGTRWSAVFFAPDNIDLAAIGRALQDAVDRVDAEMSPWKPDSVVSRFKRARDGAWIDLPEQSFTVLDAALEINAFTGGVFDPFLGSAVMAWGFGPAGGKDDPGAIAREAETARTGGRAVGFDRAGKRLCKKGRSELDLCGIAKGHGVDQLSEVLTGFGITRHLTSIDGELRAEGTPHDGRGWAIAIERPDVEMRAVALGLEIADMAVATSGSYRHVRTVNGRKVSHTIDPATGAPVDNRLVSVTVLADTAMLADGLATALMVMGGDRALGFCTRHGIAALMIEANAYDALRYVPSPLFAEMAGADFPK